MQPTDTPPEATRETLARDMRELGIARGDLLFIHASFRSLGPVQGGAGAVVAALEDVVGPSGLILMPSFNLLAEDRKAAWNIETAPATTGWLTEYFRRMQGTVRSNHFSHSVAARGQGAEEFVKGHLRREGWKCDKDINSEPWGYAFGFHSPMYKAYAAGGKMLFIGAGYQTATYLHFVEARYATEYLKKDPAIEYNAIFRPAAGAYWESLGKVRHGRIGNADCRLCGIRDFVDTIYAAICARPHRFLNVWEPKSKGIRRVTLDGHAVVFDAGQERAQRPEVLGSGNGLLTVVLEHRGALVARQSADQGVTWQPAPVPTTGGQASERTILSDGQILMAYPISGATPPVLAVRIVESDPSEFNAVPEFIVTQELSLKAIGSPAAVEYTPGRILLAYAAETTAGHQIIGVTRLKMY